MSTFKKITLYTGISITVFLVDRFTKYLALTFLSSVKPFTLIPRLVSLQLVYNTGTAFGMFKERQHLFIAVSAVFIIALAIWFFFFHTGRRAYSAVWPAMITGGALGNIYDRLAHGYVVDFIDCKIWPVFNIADMCITMGAILFVFGIVKEK